MSAGRWYDVMGLVVCTSGILFVYTLLESKRWKDYLGSFGML